MAQFSWSMQIIKRSAGRSAVAAAAYRAGERLHDERGGCDLPLVFHPTATGARWPSDLPRDFSSICD